MPKRIHTDDKVRAHTMCVREGWTFDKIALALNIHTDTVRQWAKRDNWLAERTKILMTPLDITERLMKVTAKLLDDIDKKLDGNENVADNLLNRLDKLSNSINRLDGQYDERGATVRAMGRLIEYCIARNEKDVIKGLHRILTDFYKATF